MCLLVSLIHRYPVWVNHPIIIRLMVTTRMATITHVSVPARTMSLAMILCFIIAASLVHAFAPLGQTRHHTLTKQLSMQYKEYLSSTNGGHDDGNGMGKPCKNVTGPPNLTAPRDLVTNQHSPSLATMQWRYI